MTTMTVHIIPDDATRALGKLADAELHFTDGPLAGLKLVGFGIWAHRTGSGRNVTFPTRQYEVGGERRFYSLLRVAGTDRDAVTRISDLILAAYADLEEGAADDVSQCGRCGAIGVITSMCRCSSQATGGQP